MASGGHSYQILSFDEIYDNIQHWCLNSNFSVLQLLTNAVVLYINNPGRNLCHDLYKKAVYMTDHGQIQPLVPEEVQFVE